MGWRRDWGITHREFAKAFHAGRSRKNSYITVDGHVYSIWGNVIARRISDEIYPDHIAWALECNLNAREQLEFSFAGYLTASTMRHLNALGVRAETVREDEYGPRGGCKAGRTVALLNGREVDPNKFYGLKRLADMPKWKQPEPPAWATPYIANRRLAYAREAGQRELSFA